MQLSSDVRPLDTQMNFELVLAQYAAGILRSEDTPAIASALIDKGVTVASVAELVSLREPTWRDARALFEDGVRAAGFRIPTAEDAKRMILHWTLEAIVSRELEPQLGAERIWHHWRELRLPYELAVTRMLVLSEEWSDHPRLRPAIDAQILEEATALQRRYPKPSSQT